VTISIQSIFSDGNLLDIYSPWNFASFPNSCNSFSAWLCKDGHCLFNLITNDGTTLLVKLPPSNSQGTVCCNFQWTYHPRHLSGDWGPSAVDVNILLLFYLRNGWTFWVKKCWCHAATLDWTCAFKYSVIYLLSIAAVIMYWKLFMIIWRGYVDDIQTWCLIFVLNSGGGVGSDCVVSSQIHPVSKETYVFTLCQDYKIRVWSCQVP
jgi:hypothetical protein